MLEQLAQAIEALRNPPVDPSQPTLQAVLARQAVAGQGNLVTYQIYSEPSTPIVSEQVQPSLLTRETSDSQPVADSTTTAMVVVGESVGDKRKHEQIAASETSSVTGDIEQSGKPPPADVADGPPVAHAEPTQSTGTTATPQTFSSHCSLREHLIEENKKRAEQRRQLRAQRSAPYS